MVAAQNIRGEFSMGREVRSDTKKRTDSQGMTLIELIVTFAVAAIFMTAAAMLIAPATKMTLRIKGMNRVHSDAAIIMETVVNELSYADSYLEDGAADIPAIKLSDPYPPGDAYEGYYRQAAYSDKGGNPAVISVTSDDDTGGKGRLQIVYDAIKSDDGTDTEIRKEIDWSYGKGLYRDNEITLGFRKKPDKNIITVRLTVTNTISEYSYTQETDVRCMNIKAEKIVEELPEP